MSEQSNKIVDKASKILRRYILHFTVIYLNHRSGFVAIRPIMGARAVADIISYVVQLLAIVWLCKGVINSHCKETGSQQPASVERTQTSNICNTPIQFGSVRLRDLH